MLFTYFQTIISFCHNARVRQTDGRTDRQKGDTIARSTESDAR